MVKVLLSRLPAPLAAALSVSLERGGIAASIVESDEALLEAVLDAELKGLVHALRVPTGHDLALLRVVRRASPGLPMVLLAEVGSLDTQRAIVELRPAYYDVMPVEAREIAATIQALCGAADPARTRTGRRRR